MGGGERRGGGEDVEGGGEEAANCEGEVGKTWNKNFDRKFYIWFCSEQNNIEHNGEGKREKRIVNCWQIIEWEIKQIDFKEEEIK